MIFSVTFSARGNVTVRPALSMKRERESLSIYAWLSWESNLPHDMQNISLFPVYSLLLPSWFTPQLYLKCCLKEVRDLVLDMQVILGSAEAVHYLPLKHRPEGPPGPCPIIQTGHLTLLPSHDYQSPFCRQCSFTERTWWDSGTHLHNSQLLFIMFPSWAQDLTWPYGKSRHWGISLRS